MRFLEKIHFVQNVEQNLKGSPKDKKDQLVLVPKKHLQLLLH
jgi:hypothetical protein